MGKQDKIEMKTHAKELRTEKLKMTMQGVSNLLGVAIRTIEDYESGRRTVPQKYIDRLHELYAIDKEITKRVIADVVAEIERRYPHGIPSA